MIPAFNQTRSTCLASRCEVADTFFTRFCGLQLRKELPEGCGLLLSPCNSIHMFFMRFPIDVLFLDDALKVVGMCEGIKPWRVSSIYRTAKRLSNYLQEQYKRQARKKGMLSSLRNRLVEKSRYLFLLICVTGLVTGLMLPHTQFPLETQFILVTGGLLSWSLLAVYPSGFDFTCLLPLTGFCCSLCLQ